MIGLISPIVYTDHMQRNFLSIARPPHVAVDDGGGCASYPHTAAQYANNDSRVFAHLSSLRNTVAVAQTAMGVLIEH